MWSYSPFFLEYCSMTIWPSGEVNVSSSSVSLVSSLSGMAAGAGTTAAKPSSTTIPVRSNQLADMTISCCQIRSLDWRGVPEVHRFIESKASFAGMDKAAVFRQIKAGPPRTAVRPGFVEDSSWVKYKTISMIYYDFLSVWMGDLKRTFRGAC